MKRLYEAEASRRIPQRAHSGRQVVNSTSRPGDEDEGGSERSRVQRGGSRARTLRRIREQRGGYGSGRFGRTEAATTVYPVAPRIGLAGYAELGGAFSHGRKALIIIRVWVSRGKVLQARYAGQESHDAQIHNTSSLVNFR